MRSPGPSRNSGRASDFGRPRSPIGHAQPGIASSWPPSSRAGARMNLAEPTPRMAPSWMRWSSGSPRGRYAASVLRASNAWPCSPSCQMGPGTLAIAGCFLTAWLLAALASSVALDRPAGIAERAALLEAGRAPPLMLLDDVMSELDPGHRQLLILFLERGGQAVITTTEATHVPSAGALRIEVNDGAAAAAPALRAA